MLKKEASWEKILITLGVALLLIRVIPLLAAMAVSITEKTKRSDFALLGLQHYIDLFSDTRLYKDLRNTIGQAVLGGGLTALSSAILVWCLVQVPKRVQTGALVVLAIPALMPSALFSALVCDLCSTGALGSLTGIIWGNSFNLLSRIKLFPAISAVTEALRTAIYPTLLGVTLIKEANRRKILRLTLCYFLVRVLLMPDMMAEVTNQLHNPLIYETSDTLATFSIREGLNMANYGRSSVLDVIRYALMALMAVPGIRLVQSAYRLEIKPAGNAKPHPTLAKIVAAIFTLPALAFCLYAFHYGFSYLPQLLRLIDACNVDKLEYFVSIAEDWLEAVSNSIFAGAAYAVFSGVTAFILGYALMNRNLKFLLVAALCWFPGTGVERVLWKSLGFIGKDISWPFLKLVVFQAASIGIPLLGALALAAQLKGREFGDIHDYFKAALPSLIVIALSAFSLRYGTQLYYGQGCISNEIYDQLSSTGCGIWMEFTDSSGHTLRLNGSGLNYYEMTYRAYAFIGSLPGLIVGLIPLVLRDKLPVEFMCTGIRR